MSTKLSTLILTSSKLIPNNPEKFRGDIASKHLNNPLFHQHLQNSKLAYRYPLIHYLIIRGNAIIFGLQAGADEVSRLFSELDDITIGAEKYPILNKQLNIKAHIFTVTDSQKQYYFVTPWLALNNTNYLNYKDANWTARKQLLSRVLTGNILSAAKGLGIKIGKKLFAEIESVKPVNCNIKGSPLIGFYGQFKINFDMPPLFSIGKSVSRGFGVILGE
ncbi:MAG: CRISPR-associated endonuclease Cas6 [Candidatus Bathyarchaeota archaeon]|nr:CRISPR-associated endonuclease Cas6 [Candidatus Bathyarchaeota archaeon]